MDDQATAGLQGDGATLRKNALAGGIEAERAFELLYRVYYRRLVVFAATFRAVPEGEREDAAHEIIVRAFQRLASYDAARPLNAWVYGVARNYLLDSGRKNRLTQVTLDAETIHADGFSFETSIENRDLLERVWSSIQALSQEDRQIAMLVFYERMEPSEAARILEIPAGTLRWKLMNIRKRLRTLQEETV